MMVKRKGIASEVRELYLAHQKILMQKLESIPKLSATLDAWTSPNGLAFLGVTIHGITSKWKLINVVIGMPPIHGKHFNYLILWQLSIDAECDQVNIPGPILQRL